MADKDKFGFSDKAYGKALADAAKKGGDGKGKAFQKLDQEALDQAYGMDTSKYSGDLRDVIQNKNIEVQKNRERIQQDLAANPNKAGFKGFMPQLSGTQNQAVKGFINRGITSFLNPSRMVGSLLGNALFGPFGGILGGFLAQNLLGNVKKDITDTVNFFRPDTPDYDLNRTGTINFADRLTDAIAAPNISTGIKTLFGPKPLTDSPTPVQTQPLPKALPPAGMQYDDFINPNTGMFFDPDRGFIR